MPTTFRPYHPDQPHLLPPNPREWLPDGDLAYQIADLVDALDLAAFYAPYEGDGRRNSPYEPAMMVKILLYGYATGTFSSRRIASALQRDLAFRLLAAGSLPRHPAPSASSEGATLRTSRTSSCRASGPWCAWRSTPGG